MDTSFSADDIAFRDEVRAFFAEAYDEDIQSRLAGLDTFKGAVIDWQKRLYEKGWIAPGWPVEYGGTDWDITKKFIYENERVAAGVRERTLRSGSGRGDARHRSRFACLIREGFSPQ